MTKPLPELDEKRVWLLATDYSLETEPHFIRY